MTRAFYSYALLCLCALNPLFAAINSEAADGRLVTPVEQTASDGGETRLKAPVNARPPADIDTSSLRPTLLAPVIALLERLQTQQDALIDEVEELADRKQNDRTDEILGAIRDINERKVEIKGWNENKEALDGLTGFLGRFRDRLERVATVEDVQEAVEGIQFPIQEVPEVDLTGLAQEETLLAFGDRLPTIQNIREIGDNVVSLTARLDNIASQVEEIDVNGEVSTLKKQLRIVILFLMILIGLFVIQAAVIVFRWLATMTAKAKAKSRETAEKFALLNEILEREKNKSKT